MILFICSLILLGFVTGVFTTLKLGHDFCLDLIQNIALKKFLLKDIGFFGFLFISLLFSLLFIILGYFLSFFKLGRIASILFFIYLAYLVGIDFIVLVKCLGSIRGILFAIFGYLVWRFLIIFLFYLFIFKAGYYNKQLSCYGRCSIDEVAKKLILTFLIITAILVFLQSIMLLILIKFFVFI